jgi:hypothetical protein
LLNFSLFTHGLRGGLHSFRRVAAAVEYDSKGGIDMADPRPSRVHYEGGQPILRVENLQASRCFYVGVLGFTNAPWGNDDFTSVNRDRAGIYLCRGGQGRGGAWVWLGVEDVAVI